jgi:2-polyprenyl-6-methoxyphenol hydroxylase-like FAD-dependent oxidoreductase
VLGGLGAAVALQKQGIKCSVYERDAKFEDRRQGYGMTLSSSDNGPLAKLGILDECLRVDCASYCHWVFEPSV